MYDKIIKKNYKDKVIQYGFKYGDKGVLLIKVGQDGTIDGYKDKYIKMATYINEKYNINVVVSSNPYDRTDSLGQAIEVIDEELKEDSNILFMGNSKGATLGGRFAHNHKEISRMLLINGPLMIDWTHTAKGVEKFSNEKITFVYGEKDASYAYIPLLEVIKPKCDLKVITVKDADHRFTKMEEVIIKLIEEELINK